jgi:hypothetical protein
LLGIVIGRLYVVLPPLSSRWCDALVLAGAAVSLGVTALWPDLPRDVLHNTLLAPAFGALVLGLAKGGTLARWLSARWLVRLGEASFALYILQEPVLNLWFEVMAEPHHRAHAPDVIAGQVALLVVVSLLAWRWLELPAQRLIRRVGTRWLDGRRRWPSRRNAIAAVAALAAVVAALWRAPESVAARPSDIGRQLRAAGVQSVAYDLAAHDETFLWQTLEAVPHLQLQPFDSATGQRPRAAWVIAGPAWAGTPVARESGQPHALFRQP